MPLNQDSSVSSVRGRCSSTASEPVNRKVISKSPIVRDGIRSANLDKLK